MKRLIVAGAGFSGAVAAERTAALLGIPVTVIDRRSHHGGNSYSAVDPATGVECHCYGSHIFHTSDEQVWKYINTFGGFNDYRHRVCTEHRGRIFPMPINLETISRFYGREMTPEERESTIAWETRQLEIMDWLTDDVDWITGESHEPIQRLA